MTGPRCCAASGDWVYASANTHSCSVSLDEECFEVDGKGPEGLVEPGALLNAGNSATTMRLVSGLLAAQPFFSVITGDRSLRRRPMKRIVGPLIEMGASVMGRSGNSLAPLAIRGGDLHGIEYRLPVASAQIKSCLLIAGLHAQGETTVHQPAASRDHTERMMRAMGAECVGGRAERQASGVRARRHRRSGAGRHQRRSLLAGWPPAATPTLASPSRMWVSIPLVPVPWRS